MASLVNNFQYDIFISYRQKDNRGDRWVTEFVKALKSELDATFKEDISIYFDENPHDGLLETHDVDESLKEKLKCLIFIPIISQTYCDPKSFAWNNELLPFKKWANGDLLGLKVKLQNGNVASRILPIRIHDLDEHDKVILENELGGVIRGIDFIYKEPGVNRPLKSTDKRSENQNNIDYRNQVNRVANAVKEIVHAVKNPQQPLSKYDSHQIDSEQKKSIAVLPFLNIGSGTDQDYFSDGITEDIITQLSKIQQLKVISRTSVIQYKGTKKALPEIASELNVSFLLEGSVRQAGNQLRITAQLIEATSDGHVWAETYDRELTDVFAIQSDIARAVALELKARLTNSEQLRIDKKPTDNLEVYNLYLLGRSHYHKGTPEDFSRAVEYYKKAIDLDKSFALGYAALAVATLYRGAGYFGIRPHDAMPEAFQLTEKALELDPALSEAYTARAEIYDWYFFDWEKARLDYDKAIELNPNNALAHLYKALHLTANKKFEQAMAERAIAFELDPYSILIWGNGIWIPFLSGRPEISMDEVRNHPIQGAPNFVTCFVRGFFAAQLGLQKESVHNLREAHRLSSETEFGMFSKIILSYGLARAGEKQEARKLLHEIHQREKTGFVWPMGLALAYAHLGEREKALDYLERSYEERVGWMLWIGCDPSFGVLHQEPRFKQLVKKIGPAEAIVDLTKNDIAATTSAEGRPKQESIATAKSLPIKKIAFVSVVVVALIIISFYSAKQIFSEKSTRDGVAIIPFKNSTGKADLDYYGLGIASEIRTRLSMSKQFKFVSSMQATLPYADAQKSTSQIGDELSVDFILSGLYQMSGNKIKVVAELVDAKNGQSLWSLPIECQMQDIFQVESKIADRVLRQFNGHITELEKVSTTSNLAAYAHYMRGNRLLESNTNDSTTAINNGPIILQYEKAIELDSGFIDAWTDLIGVESFVYAAERKDSVRKTRIKKYYTYFTKHFPDSWQKKLVQAHYAYRIEKNSSKALPLFLSVLDENPENVHATYGAASIFAHQLDFENALKYAVKYVNLTPGYGSAWNFLGWILDMTGDSKNSYSASLKAWSLSHSKNYGAESIFRSVKAGSFDQLPEELKKEQKEIYLTWQNMLARNWVELKKRMIKKKDWESVMYACDKLSEVDSAIWYFKKAKREKTSFDSVFFYRLTKNKRKAFEALARYWSSISNPDDKLNLVNQRFTEVNLHIDLGEYKVATEKLTTINQDYPAFGDFTDYNFMPDYDKIKKEYPPFQAALNNLKLRPPVDIRQFIDL